MVRATAISGSNHKQSVIYNQNIINYKQGSLLPQPTYRPRLRRPMELNYNQDKTLLDSQLRPISYTALTRPRIHFICLERDVSPKSIAK